MASRLVRPRSSLRFVHILAIVVAAFAMLTLDANTIAWLAQSPVPLVNPQKSKYDAGPQKLIIKGDGFHKSASISLANDSGVVGFKSARVKNTKKIVVKKVAEADIADGVDVTIVNPDGNHSTTRIVPSQTNSRALTESDVRTIIAQAVAQAEASGLRATIAVTDKEGNVLGLFQMRNAPNNTRIGVGRRCTPAANPRRAPLPCGLEGVIVPSAFAAISKAGSGAFLSSQGHAFSTRTASFIIQEHFPPGILFVPSGPLFGVQFSQLLCSDVNARLPLGLSADPGGLPVYKNGILVGGVGVEGDGLYTADLDPRDDDQPVEEIVALAAIRGFESPPEITGTILVNAIRFPYVNAEIPPALATPRFEDLPGDVVVIPGLAPGIRGGQPSRFRTIMLDGLEGRVDDRFFPFIAGSRLSAGEVRQIIVQAAAQAFVTRAAIRQPRSDIAQVNISVVDVDGTILGIFSTPDAPVFGFDVCVQKARTAAFLSGTNAAQELRRANGGRFSGFVDAGAADGILLNGSIAFSDRAGGFLSRPFFPDGIDNTPHGPFSVPIEDFSPFNNGLQLELILPFIERILFEGVIEGPCTSVPGLANGLQIFPGSVPLYKNGQLVGGIGVSGDGVDQDDVIAAMGSAGFEAPPNIRSDQVFVRGVRLPFVKFPRHPNR